ncbi:NAD-binding protein [Sanghuangporus baumii]|uniref:NAD-binding protein n=1 Tax=Sanghuangporus baumii TaxID=108892 RepID=A0A9Q5HYG6_SANBA|nr:NAD-binding protein [Sanghuangporus baumii]
MSLTFNPGEELSDLGGRVVLITGATSGVGYAAARELLRKGATVYLAAKSESKATATIYRLEAEGLGPGNGKAIWHKLDLDNPHDVKRSAEEFLARESRLDILINNAACLGKEYALGPIGVQDITTINYVSPFLFTKLLLPLLKKTAQSPDSDVRIVNVGSDAHKLIRKAQFQSKTDLNGPTTGNSYRAQMKRYAFTKLLVVLWSKELARQLAASSDGGSDVLVVCVHPGSIASDGALKGAGRLFWPLSKLVQWYIKKTFLTPTQTPTQAATTVLIAAAQPDLCREKVKYHGAYLLPFGKLASTSKVAADEGLAKDLWILTEKILADEGL